MGPFFFFHRYLFNLSFKISQILTAKDYALILGMPGTGKTSTMVHAVKALLMRGATILLTSYTNSAVDNLLIKLKAQVMYIHMLLFCYSMHNYDGLNFLLYARFLSFFFFFP